MTSNLRNNLCGRVVGLAVTFACFCLVAGCGSEYEIASISGVVTYDGEPLPNASVRFQPQRQGESPMVGPTSIAVTDEQGRFALKTYEGQAGAVVGPHVVSISTREQRLIDPKNPENVEVVAKERVPRRYRNPSELRFEVPSGGASDANFDLVD